MNDLGQELDHERVGGGGVSIRAERRRSWKRRRKVSGRTIQVGRRKLGVLEPLGGSGKGPSTNKMGDGGGRRNLPDLRGRKIKANWESRASSQLEGEWEPDGRTGGGRPLFNWWNSDQLGTN